MKRFKGLKNAAKAVSAALVLVLLLSLAPGGGGEASAVDYSNYFVRVGLQYGSSAVAYANFQVATGTGTGFVFGYYKDDRSFEPLYSLDGETEATVIRSDNFNVNTLSYVSDGADANSCVGAYHLELNADFGTQAELDAAVSRAYGESNYFSYPAFTRNGYRVRIGRFTSAAAAQADLETVQSRLQAIWPGATLSVVGKGANAWTVYRTGSRHILYEMDGATRQLGLRGIGSAPEIWTRGYKYLGGFDFVKGASTLNFSVVSVVNLVEYVKGVAPYELGASFPAESQKAHAVCAATFGIKNKNRHSSYGFDVCTGQHCQVYQGTTRAAQSTMRLVEEVAGVIIMYNGEPIDAVYHSSNGGYTENSENVWVQKLPYLRAVPDNFETLTKGNNGLWTTTMTGAQLRDRLTASGYSIGTVTNVYVSKFTEAGNVYSLTFSDGQRTVTLSKENMRLVIGTNNLLSQRFAVLSGGAIYVNSAATVLEGGLSAAYTVNGDKTVSPLSAAPAVALTATGLQTVVSGGSSSSFTFDGRGWGHNLGLSQLGSKGMADAGWTYEQILKYYYTGVDIVNVLE